LNLIICNFQFRIIFVLDDFFFPFPFGGILENTNLSMRAGNYFPIDGVYGKFSFRFCKLDRKIIPDDLLWFAE